MPSPCTRLDAVSFAGNADYRPETFSEFREEHLDAHDLDPGLSLVARHRDAYAAFLLARRWREEGVGYVDILAVHPDFQRRGLGSALLRASFHRFAAAACGRRSSESPPTIHRALRLYERVGMVARFQAVTYERPVSTPPPSRRRSR